MNFGQIIHTHTTASGAADAPALGTRDAGVKWTTGQRNKLITPKREVRIATWNVRTGHHVGQKRNHCQRATKLQDRHRSSIRTSTNWLWKNNNPTSKWQRKDDAILLWWKKARSWCRIYCE